MSILLLTTTSVGANTMLTWFYTLSGNEQFALVISVLLFACGMVALLSLYLDRKATYRRSFDYRMSVKRDRQLANLRHQARMQKYVHFGKRL